MGCDERLETHDSKNSSAYMQDPSFLPSWMKYSSASLGYPASPIKACLPWRGKTLHAAPLVLCWTVPKFQSYSLDWLIAECTTGYSLHMVLSCNFPHLYRVDHACLGVSFPYLDFHVHLHRYIFLKLSLGKTSPQYPMINIVAWGKYIHLHI